MSLDEDWYDPLDDVPPKEEPDCPPCGDSGFVVSRGRDRNCASCNPTRRQHLWWRLTWRPKWWVWRLRHGGQVSDEAPF